LKINSLSLKEANLNFDKLTDFVITIVLTAALAGNLDSLTKWVNVATAKLVYESRSETWGSPRVWREQDNKKSNTIKTTPNQRGK